MFQWSFKWVSRVFKISCMDVEGVSKVFQGCFKELLAFKKESSVFQENFIKSFKGV